MKHEAKPQTGLRSIPGVGPSIESDMVEIGIKCVADLRGKDPEDMYRILTYVRRTYIDRCVLYVFRAAVYYAENEVHDPELLKWWNWKDKNKPFK